MEDSNSFTDTESRPVSRDREKWEGGIRETRGSVGVSDRLTVSSLWCWFHGRNIPKTIYLFSFMVCFYYAI